MSIRRLTATGACLAVGLALAATEGCAPRGGTATPAPTRTFQTIDEAKDCAREALLSAGFHAETRTNPSPAGGILPGETATSINTRLITSLPAEGKQIDYAVAAARLRVGADGDTTITVQVSVSTQVWDDRHLGAVQPPSTSATRARDAVETRCILVSGALGRSTPAAA
jgi:hypothetical protein